MQRRPVSVLPHDSRRPCWLLAIKRRGAWVVPRPCKSVSRYQRSVGSAECYDRDGVPLLNHACEREASPRMMCQACHASPSATPTATCPGRLCLVSPLQSRCCRKHPLLTAKPFGRSCMTVSTPPCPRPLAHRRSSSSCPSPPSARLPSPPPPQTEQLTCPLLTAKRFGRSCITVSTPPGQSGPCPPPLPHSRTLLLLPAYPFCPAPPPKYPSNCPPPPAGPPAGPLPTPKPQQLTCPLLTAKRLGRSFITVSMNPTSSTLRSTHTPMEHCQKSVLKNCSKEGHSSTTHRQADRMSRVSVLLRWNRDLVAIEGWCSGSCV
jgi:hypothetical protein